MSIFQGFTNANEQTSYFELKGEGSKNWSLYPALQNVNMSGNSLIGANSVFASNVIGVSGTFTNLNAGNATITSLRTTNISGLNSITFATGGGVLTADASTKLIKTIFSESNLSYSSFCK
jgi:hypothetical protein